MNTASMPRAVSLSPAKLREELGVTFYLAMGVDECLAIYPQETWNRFTEKFASPAHEPVGRHAPPVC